ncbi:hypothetical protein J5T34_18035 [Cupriavidus gilardii]|uniref:hypothetical protein n=1 Tax=Cupriavidus gilardii TaxID=82541 RepID=UPI001ABDAE2B|nr:hypothetical protein [Cupriavidus gilardii]MBO4122631.1 hypothetical protein [Cupriavidus gilardii]
MKLAESFKVWERQYEEAGREKGRIEGRLEGRLEGEALLLKTLLIERFGELPAYVLTRIEAATEAQISAWGARLLRADTLSDVFEDTSA